MKNLQNLRILQEGYPLTLKQGTGIHNYALELLRALDPHCSVDLLLMGKGKTAQLPESVRQSRQIIEVAIPRLLAIAKSALGLSNPVAIPHSQYDIFHCTHLSPLSVPGIPRVTTIHDLIPMLHPTLVTARSAACFPKLLQANLAESNHIITVSHAVKRDLLEHYRLHPETVAVVYEAAGRQFKPITFPDASNTLEKFGLASTNGVSPYFIFLGNIEPKKNVKRILEAFCQFTTEDSRGYRLVLAGAKGWNYEDVEPLLTKLTKAGKLIWTGYLPTGHLPPLLSHARALLFPSLVEGFGLPVLEAMACGCPVITSNIPAINEVAGNAAIQVNPLSTAEIFQAIRAIAENDHLAHRLSQMGLQQNQKYSWERCARETLEVFRQVLERRERRREVVARNG